MHAEQEDAAHAYTSTRPGPSLNESRPRSFAPAAHSLFSEVAAYLWVSKAQCVLDAADKKWYKTVQDTQGTGGAKGRGYARHES